MSELTTPGPSHRGNLAPFGLCSKHTKQGEIMVLAKDDKGHWVQANLRTFVDERELRDLLASDPQLIPGCDEAVAATELTIPGMGRLDLVAVTSTGIVTLVECKLNKNPEIRRSVIGQILAYASGLTGTDFDLFDALFAARHKKGLGVREAMALSWGDRIDHDALRDAISEALTTGSFRLVVAVDQITDELRSIIEYLNDRTSDSVSVMALELGRFKQDQVEVLIPNTYGAEMAAAKEAKKSGTRKWSEQAVRDALLDCDGSERALVDKLLDHAAKHNGYFSGGVGAAPSGGFYYTVAGQRRSVWSLYVKPAGAVISLNLGSIRNASEATALAMIELVKPYDWFTIKVGSDAAEWPTKFPEAAAAAVIAENSEGALMAALDTAIAAIQAPEPGTP